MKSKDLSGRSRVERRKEETKRKIVDTALELFGKQGFEATTMEQIAEEVDIAKGTLYNYFPVKEEILNEYIKRSFKENNSDRILRLRNISDTRSRVILIMNELMEGVRAQKEIFEKYLIYLMKNTLSFQPNESTRSGFHVLITELIALGQKNNEIRKDLPDDILIDQFVFIFIEIAKQFYLNSEKFKVQEEVERCVDLFMNGVKNKDSEGV